MATKNLRSHFQAEVDIRLKELQAQLDDAEKQALIEAALANYSQDRPATRSADVTGTAGFDYALNTTNFPSFEDGFSVFELIEYPYDSTDADPNALEDDDWTIYQAGTTKYLRFVTAKPAATETIRAHYTYPYVFDASGNVDVPLSDFRAICDLAAAKNLRALASKMTSTGDSTFQADAISYRSKAREALDLAKAYEAAYTDHMGLGDGKASGATVVSDWDTEYSFQSDFLTHPKRWR